MERNRTNFKGSEKMSKKLINGVKYDVGKLRWDLLPFEIIQEVVKVLTYGAQKYEDDNWKKVKNARRRYFAACCRHIVDWWLGEEKDPETGCHHLAHAICDLIFLIWFDKQKEKKDG